MDFQSFEVLCTIKWNTISECAFFATDSEHFTNICYKGTSINGFSWSHLYPKPRHWYFNCRKRMFADYIIFRKTDTYRYTCLKTTKKFEITRHERYERSFDQYTLAGRHMPRIAKPCCANVIVGLLQGRKKHGFDPLNNKSYLTTTAVSRGNSVAANISLVHV